MYNLYSVWYKYILFHQCYVTYQALQPLGPTVRKQMEKLQPQHFLVLMVMDSVGHLPVTVEVTVHGTLQHLTVVRKYEPQRDKNKMTYVPSHGSDQPGHPPSLISLRSAFNG